MYSLKWGSAVIFCPILNGSSGQPSSKRKGVCCVHRASRQVPYSAPPLPSKQSGVAQSSVPPTLWACLSSSCDAMAISRALTEAAPGGEG